MFRVEALADSIASFNQMLDPDSEAYQLRNPGLLKAYTFSKLDQTDENCRRIFPRLYDGYRALVCDIEKKIRGERRGIKGPLILKNLLSTYNAGSDTSIFQIVDFLQRALKDDSINANTDVLYFLEDHNGRNTNSAERSNS